METIKFLLWAALMAIASVAFQIALANGHFRQYEWALPWLWATAGGVFLAWLILTFANKKSPQLSETSQPTQKIDQRIEASPQQHVHIGSDLLHQAALVPGSSGPTKRHPELELVGYRRAMIAYEHCWNEIPEAGAPANQWRANAFVAVFRLKGTPVGEKPLSARDATAHLTYRNDAGAAQVVNFGTWVGHYAHKVSFRGDSHALLLSSTSRASEADDGQTYVLNNPNSFNIFDPPFRSGMTIWPPEEQILLPNCTQVEIEIRSFETTLFRGNFRRTVDGWTPQD